MNVRAVGYFNGHILRLEGLFMLPALVIALVKGEDLEALAFMGTIVLLLVVGSLLLRLKKTMDRGLHAREGFVTVALAWIAMSLFGALPFFISGAIPNFIDCWFETVSGFTTTGASILSQVEGMSMSLLYWRSFTHWLGGMGVLVFMLAVVPWSEGGGETLHLLRAESPGPSVGKLVPKMRQTARILYTIYLGLTVIQVILLLAGGMPLFDSITNTFSTAGTGGFSIKNTSMAAYDSYYLQGVVSCFMVLFGVNFSVFHLILVGEVSKALRNTELRTYLGIIALSTIIITINIAPLFSGLFDAFHHAFFQTASIITTTGFATTDFNTWPELSKIIMLVLMVLGASAGSTGGGLKVARVLILGKSIKNQVQKLLHPRSVKVIKIDGQVLDDQVVRGVHSFFTLYCIICALSILIVAIDNFDMETSITSVISCIGNVGPGFSIVGPMGNYGSFSALSKLVLTADMLIGRLEIYPILLLFVPSVWKRGR